MKQKIAIVSLIAASVVAWFLVSPMAYADGEIKCAILPQSICDAANSNNGDVTQSGVYKLLIEVLKVLTALVGVIAVGMFVWAGILYSSGDGNSNRVSQAKTIITNTTFGIVAYGLMYLALNWLIPGGIFN